MSNQGLVSLVLPCRNQADHIEGILQRYLHVLRAGSQPFELVVVPNACTDDTVEVVEALASRDSSVRVAATELGGWGHAVYTGLAASRGDWLLYTNTARTEPEILPQFLATAQAKPNGLVKAWRQARQAPLRSLGSMLYNFEARMLFGLRCHDVNGTPKVFPRSVYEKVELREMGDLVDLELLTQAQAQGAPIIEIPLTGFKRHGGKSSTTLQSAWKMYGGAVRLWFSGSVQRRAA